MTEQKRNEIVSRFKAGASIRRIARDLELARNTVSGVLAQVQAQCAGTDAATPSRRRSRQLDQYEPVLQELLGRYPDLTAMRLLDELRQRGFSGGYTAVRQRLRELRPKAAPAPVIRFETGPGLQAQMDYAVYDIDFTSEGRRRIYLFSYILGYSRRQYLRFVETQDFATTVREHVPRLRASGGCGSHMPVRQPEGRRDRPRGRRADLQRAVPGLCHPLRLSPRGLPPPTAPDER